MNKRKNEIILISKCGFELGSTVKFQQDDEERSGIIVEIIRPKRIRNDILLIISEDDPNKQDFFSIIDACYMEKIKDPHIEIVSKNV